MCQSGVSACRFFGCINVPTPVPIRKLADGKYTVRIFEGGLSNVSGGVGAYAEILKDCGADEYGHINYETVDTAVMVFTDKTDIIVDSYHDWAYDFGSNSEKYVHFSDIWDFFERVCCSTEIVTIASIIIEATNEIDIMRSAGFPAGRCVFTSPP